VSFGRRVLVELRGMVPLNADQRADANQHGVAIDRGGCAGAR
jgi:hypothetical protein